MFCLILSMFDIDAFCTWFVSIIQNVKLHNVNAFKTNGKELSYMGFVYFRMLMDKLFTNFVIF